MSSAAVTRGLAAAVVVVLAGLVAVRAEAQFSSRNARQRYDRVTKGTNIDDFVKRLGSEDADTRLEAVKSLANSKDKKAVEYIIQAVGDPDERVQAKAVVALGDLRADPATPVLVQYLSRKTTDPQLKHLIVASLGKIGDPAAAQPIMEFLHRDLDPDMRGAAIFALGEIGAPESLSLLNEIARDDGSPSMRRVASEAAYKVNMRQAAQAKEAKAPAEHFLEKEPPPGQGPQQPPPPQ